MELGRNGESCLMFYYLIECGECGEDTHISTKNSNEEPIACPMCGSPVNPQLIDGDDEEVYV